jgi:hypothetical protein
VPLFVTSAKARLELAANAATARMLTKRVFIVLSFFVGLTAQKKFCRFMQLTS